MKGEEVNITTLEIRQQGQLKHFEVKLPRNTKFIIGVETGVRWGEEQSQPIESAEPKIQLGYKRNPVIGDLRLMSCEEANIFYATEITQDANLSFGDYSKKSGWRPKMHTHQNNSFEDPVTVDGDSTVIHGTYRDIYGKMNNLLPNYTVKVYIWTQRKEPDQQPEQQG